MENRKVIFLMAALLTGSAVFFLKARNGPDGDADAAGAALEEPAIATPVVEPVVENAGSAATAVASLPSAAAEPGSRVPFPGKTGLLREILAASNDNDPRLDRELRVLTAREKKEFRDVYRGLKPEDRNGRGTVIFLLGRNLTDKEDFDFLEDVMSEPPCRGPADCRHEAPADEHDEGVAGAALNYPQEVVLQSLRRAGSDPAWRSRFGADAQRVLKRGTAFESASVAERSRALAEELQSMR